MHGAYICYAVPSAISELAAKLGAGLLFWLAIVGDFFSLTSLLPKSDYLFFVFLPLSSIDLTCVRMNTFDTFRDPQALINIQVDSHVSLLFVSQGTISPTSFPPQQTVPTRKKY